MKVRKYPQPPFMKYVKTKCGYIVETENRFIEPAVFDKNGRPLTRFGWDISFCAKMVDNKGKTTGFVDMFDTIVATSDRKEDLEQ